MLGALTAAAGLTSVVGSLFGSSSAKNAAKQQADNLAWAQQILEVSSAQQKQHLINFANPAVKQLVQDVENLQQQSGMDTRQALQTVANTRNIATTQLSQANQTAQQAMMGNQPVEMVRDTAGNYRPSTTSGFRGASAQLEAGRDIGLDAARARTAEGLGAVQQGFGTAQNAAQTGFGTAREDITQGETGALGSITQQRERAVGQYGDFVDPSIQAANQEAALSGALGPEAQQQAMDTFIESPGQAYLREEQERALLRNQAAIGGLGGGNVRSALQEQAMGRAATNLQQYQANLGSIANRGANLLGGQGQLLQGFTGQETNVLTGAAQNKANLAAQLGVHESQLASTLGLTEAELATQLGAQELGTETGTATNLANLAQQTGMSLADLRQNIGFGKAGITQQTGGDTLATRQFGSQQQLSLGELAAQQQYSNRINLGSGLANIESQRGTNLANLQAGIGAAQATGTAQSGQYLQQGLMGMGNAAMYGMGLSSLQPPNVGVNTTTTSGNNPAGVPQSMLGMFR